MRHEQLKAPIRSAARPLRPARPASAALEALMRERERQIAMGHDPAADDASPRPRQAAMSAREFRRALARITALAADEAQIGADRMDQLPGDPAMIDARDLKFVESALLRGTALGLAALERVYRMHASARRQA